MAAQASARDRAEIAAGKGSTRDKAEAARTGVAKMISNRRYGHAKRK